MLLKIPLRICKLFVTWKPRTTLLIWKGSPETGGESAEGHEDKLGGAESDQPGEGFVHKPVGVEADAEHVDAEPGEGGDDVAEDGHDHEPAAGYHFSPPDVKDQGIPENDHQGAVFLRVPAPKAAPALVRPDAAQHGSQKTEKRAETDDAIHHARQILSGVF